MLQVSIGITTRKLCYLFNEELESCRIFDESNKRVTEVNSEYRFWY